MSPRASESLKPEEQALLENTYYQYRDIMYAVALSCLHNEADAEDIVHEVFLKLARKYMPTVERLSREGALSYYLMTVTRNTAISHLRKAESRKEFSVDPTMMPDHLFAEKPLTELLNDYPESNDLTRLIGEMEPAYQDVLYQRYVMELSVKEIADAESLSAATVKNRLRRAKYLLWKKCKEREND